MAFLFLLLLSFQSPSIYVEHNRYINFFRIASFSKEPVQKYYWTTPPNIRLCENTEISLSRVRQAVKYWEKIGYEFGEVYLDRFSFCMNPKYNEIAIVLPSQGVIDNKMGVTRVYTSKVTGEIVKAKIFVLPSTARKDRVLEHEFGHALGWQHYNSRGHIMHPNWWLGGHSSYGVRK